MKKSFINTKFRSMLLTSFLTEAAVMLLQISDTLIAGALVGSDGISAISLVTPIYTGVAFLAMMVTTGCAILFDQAVGAFETKKANQYFSEGLIAVLVLCVLCLIFGLGFLDTYIEGYGVSETIASLAQEYGFYYKYVFFLTPLFLFLTDMVYADGDETTCNICNAVYFVSNIAVSILTCHFWGMRGIGFGSLVGLVLGIGILSTHFFKKTNQIHFGFYFQIKDLLQMMKYSFLDASAYLYNAVSITLMDVIVVQRFGEKYLPVYAAVLSLIEIMAALDGVGNAMTPLLNVFRGEKNGLAEKSLRKNTLLAAVLEGLAFAVVTEITAPFLPQLFNIEDAEIYALTVSAFRYLGVASIGMSVLFMMSSYYLVSDHIILASIMIGINALVLPISIGFLLSFPMGIDGLWLGYVLAGIVTILITALYILIRYGKSKLPFLYEPEMCEGEIYNFNLTVPEIMDVRDRLEKSMKQKGIPAEPINLVMLLCEEIPQVILERNGGKPLLIECTLLYRDELELIFRDAGVDFDITDEDLNVTSLRSMVVSSLVTHIHDKGNLITTSYNRNVFKIPYNGDES